MDVSPEVQAQIDEQKLQCVFCKIVSGEAESKKVYEDDVLLGVLDIRPAVAGHVIFLPKEHYPLLPFVPELSRKHIFGGLPLIAGAVMKAMLATGLTVFVANGGAAGQQSPHFLFHVFPRERGDGLDFSLSGNANSKADVYDALKKRLQSKSQNCLYEDSRVVVSVPQFPVVDGHVVVSLKNNVAFELLDGDSSLHLLTISSVVASLVFEVASAQGTNIVLNSGISGDCDGSTVVHIVPRFVDDNVLPQWEPREGVDLDVVAERIRDKTFIVQHELMPKKSKEPVNLDVEAQHIGPVSRKLSSAVDEIREAIRRLRG